MEKDLNFTSIYIQCESRNWGDLQPNGSYSGMVGHTKAGHVDFIGTSLTVKASRYGAVDYLHPIGTETYAILLPSIERCKCCKTRLDLLRFK